MIILSEGDGPSIGRLVVHFNHIIQNICKGRWTNFLPTPFSAFWSAWRSGEFEIMRKELTIKWTDREILHCHVGGRSCVWSLGGNVQQSGGSKKIHKISKCFVLKIPKNISSTLKRALQCYIFK